MSINLPLSLPCGDGGRSRLHHRATLLLNHYPRSAVSATGRQAAAEYLAAGSGRAGYLLETLPPELFVPYVPPLLASTGWSQRTWSDVVRSVGVLESMLGCVHACDMCYIDAPAPGSGSFMPWVHIVELLTVLADERRRLLRMELLEVLINDLLRGRLTPPISILDAALALVRHARNSCGNYSDHLICYWKSNPTNWLDTLAGKDYADICEAVGRAFQLFRTEELLARIEADAAAYRRFASEFGEDAAKLYYATSMHAVTSTVPFGKGSLGERAVARIVGASPHGSELVRISIPHPSLIGTGRGNPGRYWAAVENSLRTASPRLVYLFAATLDQLLELVEHVAGAYERSEHPWWIESRLALYEIRAGRKRGDSDPDIISRLRRILKKLCFIGCLEGRGKQFAGSPLFRKGSVMCVNGVVVAPDRKLHFQACTTPEGGDLDEGRIVENIHTWTDDAVSGLVSSHPLTNRARELVTPGLATIPLHERRKPWCWFQDTVARNRADARYAQALQIAGPIAALLSESIRL